MIWKIRKIISERISELCVEAFTTARYRTDALEQQPFQPLYNLEDLKLRLVNNYISSKNIKFINLYIFY